MILQVIFILNLVAIRAKCPHNPPCIQCQNFVFQVIPINKFYHIKKSIRRTSSLTIEELEKMEKEKEKNKKQKVFIIYNRKIL